LEELASSWTDGTGRSRFSRWDAAGASRAARAAACAIRELSPLADPAPASQQLGRLATFLRAHRSAVGNDDPLRDRLLRAEEALLGIIDGLAAAHRTHHDLLWDHGELAADLRHHIEQHTFAPDAGGSGVQLVDAVAAPFGDFDALHIVGLVEGDWPRRRRRNIFYSPALLSTLGWPSHPDDQVAPARAAFIDLLQSAATHASVSTFTLEDDAIVEPSSLLDDIGRAGLTPIVLDRPAVRVFEDEALMAGTLAGRGRDAYTTRWAALRAGRLPASLARFHGEAGPQKPRARSVSAYDLYGQCPFKFYARYVLRLPEERDDDDGLTPLERGRLHHEFFEALFAAWQGRGRTGITPSLLEEARALAVETMETHLARLPASDAALERTRLVGSPVAAGLIDVVLRLEAERPAQVVERRLEHAIDGTYTFRGADGPREIEVRGIADRIDLLADGTFRVFDYKASRPGSPLQIAVYATCVRQKLRGYRGRDWQLAEAAYIAFRGDKTVVPLAARPEDNDVALEEAEREVVAIADAIAAGRFPPRPRVRSMCTYCAYQTVCRKDYVDDDDPTPAV
jgi:RecB family exonuclease